MKQKFLLAMLFSIAMVCSAYAQEVHVSTLKLKNGKCTVVNTTGKCAKETNLTVFTTGEKDGTTPLVIVNGEVYTKGMDTIAPEDIESIDVLKGEAATDAYGPKAKDGVIKVTLKKPMDVTKALIVIDGKVTTKKYVDVKPKAIKSIHVLKGKTAVAKYGEKAACGAIELTMK